jgi:hypothetical protein
MKVKWTEFTPLSSIPEEYWGEDLSKLDHDYEGQIIGVCKNIWGVTFLSVACSDGKIRECKQSSAIIISNKQKP